MRHTGKRSNTSPSARSGRSAGPAVSFVLGFFLLSVVASVPAAQALDLFTLWRQPMIPLQMQEGAWADYRTQVMAGGRRSEGLTRIVCLDRRSGSDDESWLVEMLPLQEEEDGSLQPVPGEGLRLRISRSILRREGSLLDAVTEVVQWRDGRGHAATVAELRDDPLVSASLESDFVASEVQVGRPTTRVVRGRQYLCDQFVFSAADTQAAELPAGRMIQTTTREISAAVNSRIPFLGLAFVTERVRAESILDPPSRKFSPPPARVRVEIMELVDFGGKAKPFLPGLD